jgi:membrane-bound metal-dependent hydrolase YbcI (DUF457 family)
MPDRRTHSQVGAIVGAGAALYHARAESGAGAWMEVLGGAIGGMCGGRLPDVLEPATSPQHRDVAHSLLALIGVASLTTEAGRRYCRARAAECAQRQLDPMLDRGSRLSLALAEAVWKLLAGALAGLQAGYVSHLVLDGHTPHGLPLVCR